MRSGLPKRIRNSGTWPAGPCNITHRSLIDCRPPFPESTVIRGWDKAVKYAADAGWLAQTALMITGSDLAFIQDARMRFPGRRGNVSVADFHLYPLSFKEFLTLEGRMDELEDSLEESGRIAAETIDAVFSAFSRYLLHGGYLTAINDLAEFGTVRRSTLATYSDWIRGDVLKRGRREPYLREILAAIVKRYATQVTWNALARDLSIAGPRAESRCGRQELWRHVSPVICAAFTRPITSRHSPKLISHMCAADGSGRLKSSGPISFVRKR